MNRASKIILIIILILIVLAGLGWLGYDNYQQGQQLDELQDYQTVTENEGALRYDDKLTYLKDRLAKLQGEVSTSLDKANNGRYYADNPDGLKERLLGMAEEISRSKDALDTAYYGSDAITEDDLIELERSLLEQIDVMRGIEREDSRIAKEKARRYRYQLRAYRDSMSSYLRQKRILLDSLQRMQELMANSKQKNNTLQDERNRLLEMLESKDYLLDSLSSDTTSYARTLRSLEDSLSMVEGRDKPAEITELRCYYIPRDWEKRGEVWLNEQPIHTPNKIRDVYVEFDIRAWAGAEESKVEVVLRHNGVPIRSLDAVATDGTAATNFECGKKKLLVGDYEVEIKYMGEVIRSHKFKVSKPSLF